MNMKAQVADDRINPKACPVCGSGAITQILCDTLLSAHFRGMACPSEGVVAYHCEGSHVFLILRSDFRWGKPVLADSQTAFDEAESERAVFGPARDQSSQAVPSLGKSLRLFAESIFGRTSKFQSLDLAQ